MKNLIFAVLVAREPSLFGSEKAAGDNDVKLGELGGAPFGQRPTRGLEARRPHHRRRARKGKDVHYGLHDHLPSGRASRYRPLLAGCNHGRTAGLSAGSPRYWAGWAFLATFSLCIACISADLLRRAPALVERRMRSGPTAEKESKQKVIQSITGAVFIGFLIVAGLDFRFVWSAVPLCILILGHVLMILSFSGIYLVFRENSFASSTIETAADQRRVDTGPYAIIRHPHDPDLPHYNVTLRGTRRRPQLFVATA